MNNKIFKFLVLIILSISFLYILFFIGFGIRISFNTVKKIKLTREYKKTLINNLNINNTELIFDDTSNVYYFNIPVEEFNKRIVLNINTNLKYKIYYNKSNIVKISDNVINIIFYNEKYFCIIKIQPTILPIININTNADINNNYIKSNFKYINSSNEKKVIEYNSNIKVRGATSKRFQKKSFKIKFYSNNYASEKNINIPGFYNGSSLVLDSVYRDSSKIRNVLSTELWNNISNDYTNISINNEFVELFINNKYHGLYVLTEPINKTKLELQKSFVDDTSIIIKSTSWITVNYKTKFTSINSDKYLDYELKYPNDEELYSLAWESILPKLSDYYINNSDYDTINNTIDMNNYIDYLIFNLFIDNSDNKNIKNNYFYMKNIDSKIYIQPWDMEYSFGNYYDIKAINNVKKYNDSYTFVSYDINKQDKRIKKLVKTRYKELRKKIINIDFFDKKLENYLFLLNNGSTIRDSEKWYKYDIKNEINEIKFWLNKRIEYIDKYIEDLDNE